MTKVVFNRTIPMIDRDSFLTPFDKMFDQIVNSQFPEITETVGVNPMQGTAYPKVNVYEYEDKVGVIAEIPGLDKKHIDIEVEDNGAKVIRRELKTSSFKRSFTLGEELDGDDISANFKDGILSVSIPKIAPTKPKVSKVKIK